jgi:hypothetical protein
MRQSIVLGIAFLALTGCSSFRWSDYVAPQVNGRVLDATTREPVERAAAHRVWGGNQSADPTTPGAARLLAKDMVLTDAQGRFCLGAVKDALTFSSGGMYGVRLSFTHSDYLTINTNVSGTNIFQDSPKTVPTLDVGDIFLHRVTK